MKELLNRRGACGAFLYLANEMFFFGIFLPGVFC
jgi:hypothetical protein